MDFDWDDANLTHIAAHGVSRDDAEDVFYNGGVELSPRIEGDEDRRRVVGPTNSGWVLVVAFIMRGGLIRVVTAFPAGPAALRIYNGGRSK